jgi:ferredoxin
MAHVISDKCTSCGACAESCPVEAISQGEGKYEINPDVCVDCGACVEECPVSAIHPAE